MGVSVAISVGGSPDAGLADDATLVEVQEKMGEATTYKIRYPLAIEKGDLPLLTDGRFSPGSELSIEVKAGGQRVCLVKGPVCGQQIHLAHGGAGSYLELMGADGSVAMDRENNAAVWPNMTDSEAVSAVLANYGCTPDVESTSASHDEAKHTLVQRETDLQFIRRLARRNGCLFWVTSEVSGTDTAHFKRPPLGDSPAVELLINLDSPNLDSLDIFWDIEKPSSALAKQLDLNTKSPFDGGVAASPLPALGSTALAGIDPATRSLHLAAPSDEAGDLSSRSEAALIEAGFFLHAHAQTTLSALGDVVRAHSVVKVRGAGQRHSGNYFCAGVKHVIDATSHRMELELLRNAWEG